jgi:NADPH:quinone reductase-like Zn-dependent oxidoreductase
MPKAVRFDHYGDESVLQVVEVPMPTPGPGEVAVRVVAAGTNPGEIPIRTGVFHERFPARFPEGQGSDLAGVVSAVGDGVTEVAVGDEVIGLSDLRNAQAEYAVLPAERVVPKPDGLDWDVAATLYVAGTTALMLMRVGEPKAGETVAVSGAAGGVGLLTTQLAVRAGARVLAIASEANHEALRRWGALPIAYGDGLEERLRQAAPDGIAAFLDTYGSGYADLAVRLGVPKERIVTIADFGAGQRLGVQARGHAELPDQPGAVAELARRVAAGELEVPIKARFPLDRVQDAYRALGARHGLGKIVLEAGRP